MRSKEQIRIYQREWERLKRRSPESLEKVRIYEKQRAKMPHRIAAKKIRSKRWWQENRLEYNRRARVRNIERRLRIISYYSGGRNCCSCPGCKENHIEFLCIDHINGGGAKQRRELGIRSMYYWIEKNNYPEGFRVLCHNCNMAIGFYGSCPHSTLVKDNQ